MLQNYGNTVQELPNVKLPPIVQNKGMTSILSDPLKGGQRQSWSRPGKTDLNDKKVASLISNPQNELGKKILREKFNIPGPVVNKIRQCGQKEFNGKVFSGKSNFY